MKGSGLFSDRRAKEIALQVTVPVIYACVLTFLFQVRSWNEIFDVMSMSFLFGMPTVMGFITVWFMDPDKAGEFRNWFFRPWIPVMAFMFFCLVFRLEGWACWMMALPLFLLAASFGGAIASFFERRSGPSTMSLAMLLPLLAAPLERMVETIPGTYKAYTYIDINAPAEKIWDNVTRVREIPESEDKGWLTKSLGFPRPLKAELNYLGVGAYRKAIFTKGLVFHETVLEYQDKKKMVFTIKADPYDIPSTTLDEHVVIGGQFFDVLKGTYELEKLNDETYRLHLYSHFKLATSFNFYASWWARWIMQDIQNNILQVEKKRAEAI